MVAKPRAAPAHLRSRPCVPTSRGALLPAGRVAAVQRQSHCAGHALLPLRPARTGRAAARARPRRAPERCTVTRLHTKCQEGKAGVHPALGLGERDQEGDGRGRRVTPAVTHVAGGESRGRSSWEPPLSRVGGGCPLHAGGQPDGHVPLATLLLEVSARGRVRPEANAAHLGGEVGALAAR